MPLYDIMLIHINSPSYIKLSVLKELNNIFNDYNL